MEFKSGFPVIFYVLTAIAQAAGVSFYSYRAKNQVYMALFILFVLADLYVLMKFIFKTKYIMDARQLTVKKFLSDGQQIAYSAITEVKPAEVWTTPGFGGVYRNTTSFNFLKIVYSVKGGRKGFKLQSVIVHPKNKNAFVAELSTHVSNAYISLEYKPPSDEEKEKKKQQTNK